MVLSTEKTFTPLMLVQISFFGGKNLGCAICFFFPLYFLMFLLLDIVFFLTPFLFLQKLGDGRDGGKGLLLLRKRETSCYPEGNHVSTSPVK